MPKQKGPLRFQGTLHGRTYYRMGGQDLVRSKTSLDKKRVKKDTAFANSRKSSNMFGKASSIASIVYRSLPEKKQKQVRIGQLTGMANKLLHKGKGADEVKQLLMKKMK